MEDILWPIYAILNNDAQATSDLRTIYTIHYPVGKFPFVGEALAMRLLYNQIMSLAPSLYHFSKKIGVKTLYQYKLLIA